MGERPTETPQGTATRTPAGPRAPDGARIASLDLIRGVAVCGILVANAPFFAYPMAAAWDPAAGPIPNTGLEAALRHGVEWGVAGKFITLFTLLFGAGMALIATDWGRAGYLRRRLYVLAGFGAAHGALVWSGDVLLVYAFAGLVALPALRLPAWAQLGLGAVLTAAAPWVLGAGLAWQAAQYGAFAPNPAAEDLAAHAEGLAAVQALNWTYWLVSLPFYLFYAPLTIGIALLGMGLVRTGWLAGRAPWPLYAGPIAVAAVLLAVTGVFGPAPGLELRLLAQTAVGLGYGAALILWAKAGGPGWLPGGFVALGRMAITCYLTHSVVMTVIFWGGRGFGRIGTIDMAGQLLVALALLLAQAGLCAWWLGRFRQGPVEALWRNLSRRNADS